MNSEFMYEFKAFREFIELTEFMNSIPAAVSKRTMYIRKVPVQSTSKGSATSKGSDDFTSAPASRLRYYLQQVVFAGVMADAEMVERALDQDVHGMCPGAGRGGARAARGARGGPGVAV